jgi:C4-dicarboxylate transporter/malic acid transport protein
MNMRSTAADTKSRKFGPNWFASVMGTGIVANAAALLPVHAPALLTAATVIWIAAALLLIAMIAATAWHWYTDAAQARSYLDDPAMAQFYGAPPMALLTVGAGALLVGRSVIGLDAAVVTDSVLWSVGTALGLLAAVVVPYRMFTNHKLEQSATLPTWLMPIVPPMVSASTGAALIPHLAAGQARATLLFGCYAMFGLTLIVSLVIISLVWARLAYNGPGPAETVPTWWIALGPLGQSVTAANLLGTQAVTSVHGPYAHALHAFGVAYGVPVWGFAMLWLTLAAAITLRTAREHLPFTLTWWSFTFPLGTVVTGTSELAANTGLDLFKYVAVLLYAGLVVAWAVTATNTARMLLQPLVLHAEPKLTRTPQTIASSHSQNRLAGGGSAGRTRLTARSGRRRSTPETETAARVPAPSSAVTVRSESRV